MNSLKTCNQDVDTQGTGTCTTPKQTQWNAFARSLTQHTHINTHTQAHTHTRTHAQHTHTHTHTHTQSHTHESCLKHTLEKKAKV